MLFQLPFHVISYYLLALVLILCVHEASHALMAYHLGDPTARDEGRLSLNPLRHLDFFGTITLLLAGIGWGKPVPVNPRYFENPVRDEALTALAGPLANLILAIFAALLMTYLSPHLGLELGLMTIDFFRILMDLSLLLAIFNLLPLPPLDGSKLYAVLIPEAYQPAYQRFLRTAPPFALILLVIDLYIFPNIFGQSIIWNGIGTLTTALKTLILSMI